MKPRSFPVHSSKRNTRTSQEGSAGIFLSEFLILWGEDYLPIGWFGGKYENLTLHVEKNLYGLEEKKEIC